MAPSLLAVLLLAQAAPKPAPLAVRFTGFTPAPKSCPALTDFAALERAREAAAVGSLSWRGVLREPSGRVLRAEGQLDAARASAPVKDGAFSLGELPAGRQCLTLVYEAEGWGRRLLQLEVELRGAGVVEADLVLPKGAALSGVLQGPDGGVLPHRWVKASPSREAMEAERGHECGSAGVETDADGRFTFRDLAPGPWLLNVGGPSQHQVTPRSVLPAKAGQTGLVLRASAPP